MPCHAILNFVISDGAIEPTCNYHTREDNAHHKPSLVEVVDVVIHSVLSLNVAYKSKPFANNLLANSVTNTAEKVKQ